MQIFQRFMGGMNRRQRSHLNQIRSAVRSDQSLSSLSQAIQYVIKRSRWESSDSCSTDLTTTIQPPRQAHLSNSSTDTCYTALVLVGPHQMFIDSRGPEQQQLSQRSKTRNFGNPSKDSPRDRLITYYIAVGQLCLSCACIPSDSRLKLAEFRSPLKWISGPPT